MTNRAFNIKDLGFNEFLRQHSIDNQLEDFSIGRITLEHKDRYIVQSTQGEMTCELIGHLKFTSESRSEFPVVGDWVAVNPYDDDKGLIHAIFPRENVLERQAVGRNGEKQIIAANIDYGLIVQSVNRDFSINRFERYITICNSAQIESVLILNKIDLVSPEDLNNILNQVSDRIEDHSILTISNLTGQGLEQIKSLIEPGKTYCLLGSSGVGKSTLINSLAGTSMMRTDAISESIDRGKHVTTHRELILLDSGGVIIDNPGMREVGITDSSSALEMTFEQIYELAEYCKFNDCSHANEEGCEVLAALDSEELSEATYQHFMKLEREQAHFSATVHEKRKKDKAFGKMVNQVMNQKRKNKY